MWSVRWQRRAIPPAEERDGWVLRDAIPAHVRITSALGDVMRLITAYGTLEPERTRSPEGREAWLRAAARALPDAAHLDLLGEFLFAYAHDSPEPRWPELLGTRQRIGDIHQTAAQTLATENKLVESLAAEATTEAILRAIRAAKSIPGYPAAADMR